LCSKSLLIAVQRTSLQVQHGTGNATIMSQKMQYCGGEAYLVDQVGALSVVICLLCTAALVS
jgi:hypothetical protein